MSEEWIGGLGGDWKILGWSFTSSCDVLLLLYLAHDLEALGMGCFSLCAYATTTTTTLRGVSDSDHCREKSRILFNSRQRG